MKKPFRKFWFDVIKMVFKISNLLIFAKYDINLQLNIDFICIVINVLWLVR